MMDLSDLIKTESKRKFPILLELDKAHLSTRILHEASSSTITIFDMLGREGLDVSVNVKRNPDFYDTGSIKSYAITANSIRAILYNRDSKKDRIHDALHIPLCHLENGGYKVSFGVSTNLHYANMSFIVHGIDGKPNQVQRLEFNQEGLTSRQLKSSGRTKNVNLRFEIPLISIQSFTNLFKLKENETRRRLSIILHDFKRFKQDDAKVADKIQYGVFIKHFDFRKTM